MSEKHEKWVIFALIALALWYLYKKYATHGVTTSVTSKIGDGPVSDPTITYYPNGPANRMTPFHSPGISNLVYGVNGSIVNQTQENSLPPNSTSWPYFRPAQPAYVTGAQMPGPAKSQMIRTGQFTYGTLPVLRY